MENETTSKAVLTKEAFYISLSFVAERAERLLISTAQNSLSKSSPEMKADIKAFVQQETNHSTVHQKLNAKLMSDPLMQEVMNRVNKRVDRMTVDIEGRQVLIIACLEHVTAMVATVVLEEEKKIEAGIDVSKPYVINDVNPTWKQLWVWHAREEIEHKSVAYDLWLELSQNQSEIRNWFERMATMMFFSGAFFKARYVDTVYQLKNCKSQDISAIEAHWLTFSFLFLKPGFFRRTVSEYLKFFKINFHPWQHDQSHLIDVDKSPFKNTIHRHIQRFSNKQMQKG